MATLQMTRRADAAPDREFERVWCGRCTGWGHRDANCRLPDGDLPTFMKACLLCHMVGHTYEECRRGCSALVAASAARRQPRRMMRRAPRTPKMA